MKELNKILSGISFNVVGVGLACIPNDGFLAMCALGFFAVGIYLTIKGLRPDE